MNRSVPPGGASGDRSSCQQVAEDCYTSTVREQCACYIQQVGWRAFRVACSIRGRRASRTRLRHAPCRRRLYSGSYRRPPMPPSICSALPLMNPDFFGSARKATNCRRHAGSDEAAVSNVASMARLSRACLCNLLRLADTADGMELRQRVETCANAARQPSRLYEAANAYRRHCRRSQHGASACWWRPEAPACRQRRVSVRWSPEQRGTHCVDANAEGPQLYCQRIRERLQAALGCRIPGGGSGWASAVSPGRRRCSAYAVKPGFVRLA